MNAITPIAADLSPDPSGDRAESLAERLDAEAAAMEARHLAQLEALAEIGMALAQAVGRRVAEVEAAKDASGDDDAAAAKLGELGLSFNRITRAVRLTMTLEAHVRDARRARLLGLDAERAEAARAKAQAEAKRVAERESLICRTAEEMVKLRVLRRNGEDASPLEDDDIEYEEHEEKEIEDAYWAAERLLRRGQAYAGFMDRPVSAVVAQVCADLGLTPEWSIWKDEDWAIEEAETLAGSPFAALAP